MFRLVQILSIYKKSGLYDEKAIKITICLLVNIISKNIYLRRLSYENRIKK